MVVSANHISQDLFIVGYIRDMEKKYQLRYISRLIDFVIVLLVTSSTAHGQDLFVSQQDSPCSIYQYSLDGSLLRQYTYPSLSNTKSIAFNYAGDLFVTTGVSSEIHRFSETGKDEGVFAITLGFPQSIAFDKSNNLYVISSASHDVRRFSATGADLGVFATVPDLPNDITFDSAGNLYVSNGSAVSEFSSSGTDIGNFVTFNGSIGAIAFNSADEFYASAGDNIFQFDAKGTELTAFAFPGGGPTDMAFDENGYLYTSSYRYGNVRKFSANGTDLGIFVALDGAWGLAFAPTSVPETNAPFILIIGIGIGLVCLRRRKLIEA